MATGIPLASAFVRIRPDTDKRAFRKDGEAAADEASKGFEKGWTRGADGRVRDARGRFVSGFGSTGQASAKAFNKGFGKGFGGGASIFATVAKVAASRIGLIGIAAATATPAVIHLTAALLPAAGALVAMPAAMAGMAVASATLKFAVSGVSDAIGAGLAGETEKAEKALKKLQPAARAFAKEVIALKPRVDGLRQAIGEHFFAPFIDDIRPLADVYFPLLTVRMQKLAGPLGGLAEQLAETGRKGVVVKAVGELFLRTEYAVIRLRAAVAPLVTALATGIGGTAKLLPPIADGVANLAVRFNTFVQSAVKGGAVFRVYREGVATLKELGGIAYNTGSIIRSVFQAAATTGGGLLANIRALTGQAAAFLNSAKGMAALESIFAVLAQLGDAMRVALAGVLPAIGQALQVLGPALGALAAPAAQLVVALAPLLPLLAGSAATIITKLTPAIAGLANFLAENTTLVKNLAIAASALFAVYKVGSVVMAVQAAGSLGAYLAKLPLVVNFTKIWTAVQATLNAVLAVNPIALIVLAIAGLVAGLVLAYKKSETFRRIVDAVWAAIRRAIGAVVDWITGTAWPAIKQAWDAIAAAAMWLWRNVIQPVWNGIKAVIDVVVKIVAGYIRLLVAEFRIIAGVAMWLWKNIFSPVFSAIRKIVEIWWFAVRIVFQALVNIVRNTVGTALTFLRGVFNAVFGFIRDRVVKPWWTAVRVIFTLFRTYVYGPLVGALTAARNFFVNIFNAIIRTVRNWWSAHISPVFGLVRAAWNALASAFSRIYNGNIKPIFQAFIGFIRNQVVGGFNTGVNAIRAAWDKVREYARKPVAFVVNSVINPFIGGLNKAASIVGVKDRIEPIRGFADGGQIPGTPSYRDNRLARITPTAKPLAVASGEYITNTRSTLANLDLLKVVNSKRGPVTHADIDPVLDGADHGGHVHRRGGIGDGIGGFFDRLVGGLKGAANMILNPKEALKKIADAALSKIPGSGRLVDFVRGSATRLIGKAMDWLTNFGLGGAIGGSGIFGGWRGMRAAIGRRFPGLGMISGLRPGAVTVTGRRSYHALGRAVDYPPVRALAAWIRSTFGAKTKELITPWQDLNLHNGQPHRYTGRVWDTHNFAGGNAHVHWAAARGGLVGRLSGMPVPVFDSGGILRPGLNTVYNGTGRPERLRPAPAADSGPGRLHPADIEALGRVIGREMAAAIGASNYAAGRRASLYVRGG